MTLNDFSSLLVSLAKAGMSFCILLRFYYRAPVLADKSTGVADDITSYSGINI